MTTATQAPTLHPLQSRWSFWEHRRNKATGPGDTPTNSDASYLAGIQQLCSVSTVEEFWQAFTYLPLPSNFFFDGSIRHDFVDRSVEGFSIFREGVQPMWEDDSIFISKGSKAISTRVVGGLFHFQLHTSLTSKRL